MADKIRYSISVTPIEEVTMAVSYTGEEQAGVLIDQSNSSHEVLATEINKPLGGSGEAQVSDYQGTAAAQGYLNTVVNYLEADDNVDNVDISSEATASFVFIKNTGKLYSSATELGDTLSKAVKVMSGSTLLSVLAPGECMVFKDDNAGIVCTGIHVRTVDLDGGNNPSAGHLAVEYLVVD